MWRFAPDSSFKLCDRQTAAGGGGGTPWTEQRNGGMEEEENIWNALQPSLFIDQTHTSAGLHTPDDLPDQHGPPPCCICTVGTDKWRGRSYSSNPDSCLFITNSFWTTLSLPDLCSYCSCSVTRTKSKHLTFLQNTDTSTRYVTVSVPYWHIYVVEFRPTWHFSICNSTWYFLRRPLDKSRYFWQEIEWTTLPCNEAFNTRTFINIYLLFRLNNCLFNWHKKFKLPLI